MASTQESTASGGSSPAGERSGSRLPASSNRYARSARDRRSPRASRASVVVKADGTVWGWGDLVGDGVAGGFGFGLGGGIRYQSASAGAADNSLTVSSVTLFDAGVPMKAAVAGVAMGLIKEGERYAILTDILGTEDHLGDMDFKVAGTKDGITSIQMDIKIQGLDLQLMREALAQANAGRMHILGEMAKALPEPKADLSPWAPRIVTVQINPEKIGDLIGPKGKTIRGIQDETGAELTVDDTGLVTIAAVGGESMERARQMVQAITAEPVVGETYEGPVKSTTAFGAFVEIMPGTEGLVHISELQHGRTEKTEDVVKKGDRVKVKLIDRDERGRLRLSMKALLNQPAPAAEPPPVVSLRVQQRARETPDGDTDPGRHHHVVVDVLPPHKEKRRGGQQHQAHAIQGHSSRSGIAVAIDGPSQQRREQTHGHIDVEDPGPGNIVRDPAAQQGPGHGRDQRGHGPHRQRHPRLGRRVAGQQQRLRQRDHRPGHQALQHAEADQHLQRTRQAAQPRSQHEQQHAHGEQPHRTEALRQPARQRHRDGVGHRKRGNDPRALVRRHAQVARNGRDRHVGNGRVQHIHEGGR